MIRTRTPFDLIDDLVRCFSVEVVHDDVGTAGSKQERIPVEKKRWDVLVRVDPSCLRVRDVRFSESTACTGDDDCVAFERHG